MKNTSTIVTGIIDDHPAAAFGLAAFFETAEEISVAWTVSNLDELQSQLQEKPVDVLVADFKVGDTTILEWMAEDSAPPVVIYSGFYLEENVRSAFGAGAMAWIRKSDSLENLQDAVANAAAGRKTVRDTDEQFFRRDRFVDVSERELEVLQLIYEGRSNEEIGEILDMQVTTVKTHVSHLFAKLDASSRNEAVHSAIERGLLATPDSTSPELYNRGT